MADGNFDNVVDAADFTFWRDYYGATAAAIPEPTTAVLTLAAAVGFSRRPRHR